MCAYIYIYKYIHILFTLIYDSERVPCGTDMYWACSAKVRNTLPPCRPSSSPQDSRQLQAPRKRRQL